MAGRSLSLRLVLGAGLWIGAALAVTGVILTGLFRSHAEGTFDAVLDGHLEELLAFSEVDAEGRVVLPRHPGDPQFNRPLSGWYWQLEAGGTVRSRSLWDQEMAVPDGLSPGDAVPFTATGPRGEPLRAVARVFTLPDAAEPFVIAVAGPADDIETAVRGFAGTLALALAVLGLGLIGAVVAQVRYGLRPLVRMRRALADIRAGRAARMEGVFPAEIEPLVGELNALLEHDAAVVERARTQAGNLAHALKTPLAVLTNEADRLDGAAAETIARQAELMDDHIQRHLARARTAATHDVPGARTGVGEVTEGLLRTLRHIHRERRLEIVLEAGCEGLGFRGERRDLEEMLGNLIDNACKWARSEVRVGGREERLQGILTLSVEDDGPGISEEDHGAAMGRGRRLDETMPGSGLGLDIVREIAELYGGSLELGPSSLGGLGARLRLPCARGRFRDRWSSLSQPGIRG